MTGESTAGVRLGDALVTAALARDDQAVMQALHGSELFTLVEACVYLAKSHARLWADVSEHSGDDALGSWSEALLEREAR